MAAEGVTPFQQAVAWGMTSKAGRRLGRLPHRRPGRARAHRLPRRLPPGGDRAGRRLGRGDAPGRGLGAELPDQGPRRPDLVHPRAARHLPAAGQPPHPGAQYFHYGRWRRVIVREHPETASFRYLAPPAAAAPGRGRPGRRAGRPGRARGRGARPGVRWLTGRACHPRHLRGRDHRGRRGAVRGLPAGVRLRVPLVLGVMHMCWGTGFLTSPRRLHRGRAKLRHACPFGHSGTAGGAAASGRERMKHGFRPPGPARRPPRRRIRAVRPVPEPAAAAGAARDRLRQGLRAGRGRVPLRRRRPRRTPTSWPASACSRPGATTR